MDTLMQDLRFALRQLRRSPGFTAVAVLTLGVGIGADTAVFSMVDAVLLRPLPYEAPERLVEVQSTHPSRPGQGGNLSYPDFLDIRREAETLESIAVWDWQPFNLRGDGEAAFVGGGQVSPGFFETLGVGPLRGRTFLEEEARPGGPDVVLLSEELWRSALGSDPGALDRTVILDGVPHTVVGIVPAGIGLPDRARLWVPLQLDAERSPRGRRWLGGIARLAPGVDPEAADAELAALAGRLEEAHPETNADRGLRAVDLRSEMIGGETGTLFLLLLGAVGILLLIACVNLAGLLLARASRRERELAVRATLGAGRGRLARQLLTESLVLGAAGAGLGWLLGNWGIALILRTIPTEVPAWIRVEPDLRVAGFVTGITLLAVLVFGLAPALLAARRRPGDALREASARGGGPGRARLRSGLVVAEVALSVTLLLGAGLVLRSLLGISAVDPGFATDGRLIGTTALAPARYGSDSARVAFQRALLSGLAARPGVREVGIVSRFPLRGSSNAMMFTAEGQDLAEHHENPFLLTVSATPGYFRAAGLSLLRGREFGEGDDADAPPVGIVNREMARRYWPGEDPIGERLKYGPPDSDAAWIEIVGVVEDVRHYGLDRAPTIQLYRPYAQEPTGRLTAVLHAAGDPDALRGPATGALRDVDPDQAFYDLMSTREVAAEAAWQWRFFGALFWTFAVLAALLAAVGLYGVLAYLVTVRRREFGVRLALGARPGDLLRLVLRGGGRLFAAGAALGGVAGVVVNRGMSSVLYRVAEFDLPTFGGVLLLMGVVAAAATWIPARRAAGVDPATSLRAE